MSIGKQGCVVGVEDTSSLEVGSLVAVNVIGCPPASIGKVKSVNAETQEVAWLKGAYNKRWEDWIMEDAQDRRKRTQWTDEIHRNSVLLFDFKLTASKHLSKETVTCLKRLYSNLAA